MVPPVRRRRLASRLPAELPVLQENTDEEYVRAEAPCRGYLPRDVFFLGFGFTDVSLPAAAARAFCFLVVTKSSDRRCRHGTPWWRTTAWKTARRPAELD